MFYSLIIIIVDYLWCEGKIRLNPTAEKVMKEIEDKKISNASTKLSLNDYVSDLNSDKSYKDDIQVWFFQVTRLNLDLLLLPFNHVHVICEVFIYLND